MSWLAVLFFTSLVAGRRFNRHELQDLTEFRHVHRKTVDGRLCAAAFVVDNHVYLDCTTVRAPDGSTGLEWCYVEAGTPDWGACQAKLDYGYITGAVKQELASQLERTVETLNVVEDVQDQLQGVFESYERDCKNRIGKIAKNLDKTEETVHFMQHQLSRVEAQNEEYDAMIKALEKVQNDIERSYFDAIKSPTNCGVISGYEPEAKPDGLRGTYYANSRFVAPAAGFSNDLNVDFSWAVEPPVNSVGVDQFSVRWDGWVLAPETNGYVFTLQNDGGGRVFLSDSPIIVNRMPAPAFNDSIIDQSIPLILSQTGTGISRSSSEVQSLEGGQKYKIRIEYFHDKSLHYDDQTPATVKLMWKAGLLNEEVIPAKYFYQGNVEQLLKIGQLSPMLYSLASIENGMFAFIDTENSFIADLPQYYEGKKCITTKQVPDVEKLAFVISSNAVLYIAYPENATFPVEDAKGGSGALVFHPTGDVFSIYEAAFRDEQAIVSYSMAIYASVATAGIVEISLTSGVPFILIVEQGKQGVNQCAGHETALSTTDGVYFHSCTASSEMSEEFDCRSGLSGKNIDSAYGSWRTSTAGEHGTLTVNFTSPVELTAVRYKPLDDSNTWPLSFNISFGNNSLAEEFSVVSADHKYTFNASHVTGKATITLGALASGDSTISGGSVVFLGHACNQSESGESLNLDLIQIAFITNDESFPPVGYIADEGKVFQTQNGLSYGWQYPAIGVHAENCVASPMSNEPGSGGIAFAHFGDDANCNFANCDINGWSIRLPYYGKYRVTVKAGSPCSSIKRNRNSIQVNHISVIDEYLTRGQFAEAIIDIDARSNKTLTISADCSDNCDDAYTIINSVVIKRIESPRFFDTVLGS